MTYQPYGQDPSGQQPYGRQPQVPWGPPPDHPSGTTVLILGILGLVLCQLLSPFAWSKGNTVLREIDAQPGRYGNRGIVNAGRICGIVGTVLLLLSIVLVVGLFVFGAAMSTTFSSTSP